MLQSSCWSALPTLGPASTSPNKLTITIDIHGGGSLRGKVTYTAEPGPSRARVAPVPLKMDFIPPSAYSFLTTSRGPV